MTIQTEVLKLAQDVIQMLGAPSPLHFSKDEIIKWQKCNAAIKEALAQDDLQALHDENERLGLYKDAYAQPEQKTLAWKLVPIKPTEEMLKAMDECSTEGYDERLYAGHAASVYMAAVDVAPIPPQPKEPEQEPLEYWNAVEGWVKIDEVREHFDSVGCATIYKTAGEGRVPLSLCKAQSPQRTPLTDEHPLMVFAKECVLGAYQESELADAAKRAIEAAHSIKE